MNFSYGLLIYLEAVLLHETHILYVVDINNAFILAAGMYKKLFALLEILGMQKFHFFNRKGHNVVICIILESNCKAFVHSL